MGTCDSGYDANITLLYHEYMNINKIIWCIWYNRYIDDLLIIGNKLYFDSIINNIKSIFPKNYILTFDSLFHEKNGLECNYLDCNFKYNNNNNKIISNVFTKPHAITTYANYYSNLSNSTKFGSIRGELIRRIKICSNLDLYLIEKKKYLNKILYFGYNPILLRKLHWKGIIPRYNQRQHFINKTINF